MSIKCKWREKNRILYNIDGQVYPCCYLVNNNFASDNQAKQTNNQYIMIEYNKVKDELNIFKNDFDSINKHPWWELLEQSWDDPSITLRQCKRWCTVKENTDE